MYLDMEAYYYLTERDEGRYCGMCQVRYNRHGWLKVQDKSWNWLRWLHAPCHQYLQSLWLVPCMPREGLTASSRLK